MKPLFFKKPSDFRKWFEKNADTAIELSVGFYKVGSGKPSITWSQSVDAAHPHHELVMVAENLGSIPPNTSLMVVTANNKRYEIFISSSEQKNAKIIIDLKE